MRILRLRDHVGPHEPRVTSQLHGTNKKCPVKLHLQRVRAASVLLPLREQFQQRFVDRPRLRSAVHTGGTVDTVCHLARSSVLAALALSCPFGLRQQRLFGTTSNNPSIVVRPS